MSLYTDAQEENLYIRRLSKTWLRSKLITVGQDQILQNKTSVQVVQANLFIRVVLFGFSALAYAAVVAFFLWLTNIHHHQATSLVFFVFGVMAYGAAEFMVKRHHFYRYGVEEAFVFCACVLLALTTMGFLTDTLWGEHVRTIILCLVIASSAFGVYKRFGFFYAPLVMIFSLGYMVFHLTLSHMLERIVLAGACLVGGLLLERTYQDSQLAFRRKIYIGLQSMLFLGTYLSINLRLADLRFQITKYESLPQIMPHMQGSSIFYWSTYLLTFIFPVLMLAYAVKQRRRLLLDVGILTALLTLVTNKDYLGFEHHAWDAAVFGLLLIGVSLGFIRWLGKGKVRAGFTADECLKPEDHGISLESLAMVLPQTPLPPDRPGIERGGGYSGGGASGGF